MEKQVKKIADELQLIRKEFQKKNEVNYTELTAQLHEGESIMPIQGFDPMMTVESIGFPGVPYEKTTTVGEAYTTVTIEGDIDGVLKVIEFEAAEHKVVNVTNVTEQVVGKDFVAKVKNAMDESFRSL